MNVQFQSPKNYLPFFELFIVPTQFRQHDSLVTTFVEFGHWVFGLSAIRVEDEFVSRKPRVEEKNPRLAPCGSHGTEIKTNGGEPFLLDIGFWNLGSFHRQVLPCFLAFLRNRKKRMKIMNKTR